MSVSKQLGEMVRSSLFVCFRYLRIQLEDLDNCQEAMEYIAHLPFKDVSKLFGHLTSYRAPNYYWHNSGMLFLSVGML